MRKQLLSVFALAAMCFSTVFAGEDVKLWNGDAELGMSGWDVTFTSSITEDNQRSGYTWGMSNKEENGQPAYWGFTGKCFEIWRSVGSEDIFGANSISQTKDNIPNGTYVFSAFAIACYQMTYEEGEEYVPNASDVTGVYIFANGDQQAIATENPDPRIPEFDLAVCHAERFNIATVVTDGKIKVGFKADEDSYVSYISFDNANLYYFGDVTPEAALVEMAKIDAAATVAQFDSLQYQTMQADVKAVFTEALAAVDAATTYEDIKAAAGNVRVAAAAAKKSIKDYKALADKIAVAEEKLAQNWSENAEDRIAELQDALADAKAVYAAAELDSEALSEYVADFTVAINLLELVSVVDMLDALVNFTDYPEDLTAEQIALLGLPEDFVHPGFAEEGDETSYGLFKFKYIAQLVAINDEASAALDAVDEGEMTVAEGVAYIAKIKSLIAECVNDPLAEPTLPLDVVLIPNPDDPTIGWTCNDGTVGQLEGLGYKTVSDNGYECFRYESPVIVLPYPVTKLVITVTRTLYTGNADKGPRGRSGYSDGSTTNVNEGPYFNLGEFYLYDEFGEEIPLTEDAFSSNAKEGSEGSYKGLIDRDITTFFHSAWSSGFCNEDHNLVITMPEGPDGEPLTKFIVAWENQWATNRVRNMPTQATISGISGARSDLMNTLADANIYSPYSGDDPGFYTGDFSAFFEARAKAQAVYDNPDATDAEIAEALNALSEQIDNASIAEVNLPKAGVEYNIVSAGPFFEKQQIMKGLIMHELAEGTDSVQLWWGDINPADASQRYTFEPITNADGEPRYFMKSVSGYYITNFDANSIYPSKEYGDTVKLESLALGQWKIVMEDGPMHTGDHNGGTATSNTGNYGGISGVSSGIVSWNAGVGSGSAWYIRQIDEMPISALINGANTTRKFHLAKGVDNFTITADKACAFTDLKLKDLYGEDIAFSVSVAGNSITITTEQKIESFSISFTNNEGVSTLAITGGITKLNDLKEAYQAATSVTYEQGTEVGMIKDLTAYNAAIAKAEELLANGGTDEEIDAAIKALEDAIAGLETVQPSTDKTYFIVNGVPAFFDNYGVEMGMYADVTSGMMAWSYLNINNPAYCWKFIPVEGKEGSYYLQNVGTNMYVNFASGQSTNLAIVDSANERNTYELISVGSGQFKIHNTQEGSADSWCLHANSHGSGSGKWGGICYWGGSANEASAWYIREAEGVINSIDVISTEPESINAFTEGIYDLQGRRIEKAEKGLYIINGQKVLVK